MYSNGDENKKLIQQGEANGFNYAYDTVLRLLEGQDVPKSALADDKFPRIKALIEDLKNR